MSSKITVLPLHHLPRCEHRNTWPVSADLRVRTHKPERHATAFLSNRTGVWPQSVCYQLFNYLNHLLKEHTRVLQGPKAREGIWWKLWGDSPTFVPSHWVLLPGDSPCPACRPSRGARGPWAAAAGASAASVPPVASGSPCGGAEVGLPGVVTAAAPGIQAMLSWDRFFRHDSSGSLQRLPGRYYNDSSCVPSSLCAKHDSRHPGTSWEQISQAAVAADRSAPSAPSVCG